MGCTRFRDVCWDCYVLHEICSGRLFSMGILTCQLLESNNPDVCANVAIATLLHLQCGLQR